MIRVTGATASFPVVFSDGDREVELGPVGIYPSLGFAKLQSVISEKIGVAPHQISVSLVRRKKARISPDVRRKVTIDEGTDLYALAKEKDCFILAMLRRSRRDRRARGRRGGGGRESLAGGGVISPPPELTILNGIPPVTVVDPPLTAAALWDYEAQLRELQRQREIYLMTTAPTYGSGVDFMGWEGYGSLKPAEKQQKSLPLCEQCAKGMSAFHWCVRDAVTVGFRSPAGPIQRPSRLRLEASD